MKKLNEDLFEHNTGKFENCLAAFVRFLAERYLKAQC